MDIYIWFEIEILYVHEKFLRQLMRHRNQTLPANDRVPWWKSNILLLKVGT